MRAGTNLPKVGDFNQTVVLDALRRTPGGLTRAHLARLTGLSTQALTNIVRRLTERGLVQEAGTRATSARGRPGRVVQLRPDGGFAVGVHLDPAVITFVLLDLVGTIVQQSVLPTPKSGVPSALVRGIATEIEHLVTRAGIDRDRIAGIGVASPGPIDVQRGIVLDPPHLSGWHGVPLRDALADATGLQVALDKDVLAAASAHVWDPGAHPSANFAFVYLGTGVAISFVLDDVVIRGQSGNAAESGHLVVDPDGPECACGKRGCLGATLQADSLVWEAATLGVDVAPLTRSFFAEGHKGRRTTNPVSVYEAFGSVCSAADAGDERAAGVLRQAGHRIGMIGVVVADLFDLDLVIAGGPLWHRMAPYAAPTLAERVESHPVLGIGHDLQAISSPFGEQVAAVGTGCAVLTAVFTPRGPDLPIS